MTLEEAIKFFRRKITVPTNRWTDIADGRWRAVFTVAGAQARMLEDFRAAVDDAIANGRSLEDFRGQFEELVEKSGWQPRGGKTWRARVIYDTNLRQAFAEGRCRQQTDPDVLRDRPYWEWRHRDSPNPRHEHLALDGQVFPSNHPIWQSMYPPVGFGCRCTVVSVSAPELNGRTVRRSNELRPGDVLPDGRILRPDPGFRKSCQPETPGQRATRLLREQEEAIKLLPLQYQEEVRRRMNRQ